MFMYFITESKYMTQKLTELEKERDKSTMIGGCLPSTTDRTEVVKT